jgi:hypothetical protein
MNPVSLISPMSDAEAARVASPDTHADLTQRIMATAAGEVTVRRPGARRRLLIGIPVAAGLAVAALIAGSLAGPDQRVGPINVGSAKAEAAALSFTRHGGYLDVIVRNPYADERIYRAEFAAHHLDITLSLVPVSPSLVGTLVYWGGNGNSDGGITTITARGRCWTGGSGSECPVGVRIPGGFHGQAQFVFGRAARPGEQYDSTGLVTAPGEAMHGLTYRGKTLTAVLAVLRTRHVTVPQYRSWYPCGKLPAHIPGNWRVYDADPWAAGQVLLWVGPAAGRAGAHCAAGALAPMPKASPSASIKPSASH